MLLEELEGTLLSDVAHLAELLDCLLASGVLAAADDATTLGLHQILPSEATGSMLGGAVENSRLGAYSGDLGTAILLAVLARNVATSICHLF